MKIAIIDDEAKARSLLEHLIKQNCNDIEDIFMADDLKSGVDLIKKEKPRLVFLDIEMPREQGIEILNYFEDEEIDFEIVFTTAYSDYALQAFEMNAVDYLLKPIRPKRLKEVVERVQDSFNKNDIQTRLEELKSSLQNQNFDKIGLPVQDGIIFIPLNEIIHLEADGMYTNVYQKGSEKLVVSKPLKFFEHLLQSGKTFYRPHRSHIFNLTFLKQYVRRDGNYIVLENDAVLPISKDKREEFLQIVSSI